MSFFVKSRKRKSAELKTNKTNKAKSPASRKKDQIKKALSEEIESDSDVDRLYDAVWSR